MNSVMFKLWCATCIAGTTLALSPIAAADTVGTVAGYNQPQDTVGDQLQGHICNQSSDLSPNTCTPIIYDNTSPDVNADIASGVQALDAWLAAQTGPVTVFSYSMGSIVVYTWIAEHKDDPNPPAVTFYVIGNPSRNDGGVDGLIPGGTPYADISGTPFKVTDLGRQYELFTDFPDNPTSPYYGLAVLNVVMGLPGMHDYTQIDPNDPSIVWWTDGNITYGLVPTTMLPLALGNQALSDQLRLLVETAYNRTVPIPDPAEVVQPPTEPPTEPPVEEPPVDKPGNGPKPKRQTTQEVTTWSVAPEPNAGLVLNVNTVEAAPSLETTQKTTSPATSAKTSAAPKESRTAEPADNPSTVNKAAAAAKRAAAATKKTSNPGTVHAAAKAANSDRRASGAEKKAEHKPAEKP